MTGELPNLPVWKKSAFKWPCADIATSRLRPVTSTKMADYLDVHFEQAKKKSDGSLGFAGFLILILAAFIVLFYFLAQ